MGSVTVIGPDMAQVEYRLQASAGCGLEADHEHATLGVGAADNQVDYRLPDNHAQPLRWIGSGLQREFGIEPGTPIATDLDREQARRLMSGCDPNTGEVLVRPKMARDPRGMLPTARLLTEIGRAAEASGTTPAGLVDGDKWATNRLASAQRMVVKEGEIHRLPLKDARRLAVAAGVDLEALFGADALATAAKYEAERVQVGNRGYDMTITLTKSATLLWSLADEKLAAELSGVFDDCVTEGFAFLESVAGYTMAGHHGDGKTATKVESSGLSGWVMGHEIARPVGAEVPDPHLHRHLIIAAMARGKDGAWRVPGAGGNEFHRHAHALSAFVQARFRAETAARYGVVWERDERTRQWEIVAIPAEVRTAMSKRHKQIGELLEKAGLDTRTATQDQVRNAADRTREAKRDAGPGGDLRAAWRGQVEQIRVDGRLVDVDQMVRDAAPGWDGPTAQIVPGGGHTPPTPSVEKLLGEVYHVERGLTAHRKDFRRSHALAEVLDALPGVDSIATAEALTDRVLAAEHAEQLPELGAGHMSNHHRYTTTDIVAAELVITGSADRRHDTNAAAIGAEAAAMAVGVFEASRGFTLSAEQRAVVDRLLVDGHGIDAVIGVAGAGKTTLLSAARTGWEGAGMVVAGASTAAVACANLTAESGIPSHTMAYWTRRIGEDGLAGVDVLVLDEAAMLDDRQVAAVVAAAEEAGTKLVMVGDPLQMRSPGVGGTFKHIHAIVGGQVLTENRRQKDEAERAALATWRGGDRTAALVSFAEAGHVHAVDDSATALGQMLARWNQLRETQPADVHDRIARLLLMAGTNADVDKLNAGARAIRIADGEIAENGRRYRMHDGAVLELSVGDIVMVRKNDWRAEKSGGERADVLNGFRGVVTAADATGVTVQWRTTNGLTEEKVSPTYIAKGGLSLGYALTVAKSQGLTSDLALVYGAGLDKYTAYPALSRARERTDLFLPRTLLEDDATRARLGEPATPDEALRRAINAYVKSLEQGDDIMVSPELGHALPAPRTPEPTPTKFVPDWPMAWERRYGAWTDEQLAKALAKATGESGRQQIRAVTCQSEAKAADAGAGPAMTRLRERANTVATQAQAIEAYRTAQTDRAKAEAALDKLRALRADADKRQREATGLRNRGKRADAAADLVMFDRTFPVALAETKRLQGEVSRLYRQVPRGDLDAIVAERDHYLETWAEQLADARTRDAAHAKAQRAEAAQAVTAQKAADTTAAAIRAETGLRDQMPPAARAIEDGVRQFPTLPAEVTIAARQAIGDLEQIPQQYAAWNARPFGALADRTLDERATKYGLDAEAARVKAEAFQAQADAVRQKAAEYGGPAVAELGPQQQRLAAAAAVDIAAKPIRTRQQEALDRYNKANAQWIDLEIKRDKRSTAGTWMHGATKGGLNERIADLKAEAAAAHDEVTAAARELGAMGAGKAGAAVKALREFRENLPELREQARAQDIADAEPDAQRLERRAETAGRDAAKATGNASGITAEKALRAELPAPLTGMENVSRTENRRVVAAENTRREELRAAARQRERTQTRHHDYDPPSYGVDRSGPSLGR